MSPTPPSPSSKGSTGNYLNERTVERQRQKQKVVEKKEDMTDVCFMQADPAG